MKKTILLSFCMLPAVLYPAQEVSRIKYLVPFMPNTARTYHAILNACERNIADDCPDEKNQIEENDMLDRWHYLNQHGFSERALRKAARDFGVSRPLLDAYYQRLLHSDEALPSSFSITKEGILDFQKSLIQANNK